MGGKASILYTIAISYKDMLKVLNSSSTYHLVYKFKLLKCLHKKAGCTIIWSIRVSDELTEESQSYKVIV